MGSRKKVIVVDDSRTARQQVRSALGDIGFEVVEAVDGRDGLNKVSENADAKLVICDVNMPVLGGLEMLSALYKQGKTSALPFLMLTTEAQPELIRVAKESGARGWIVKPFKPEMLLAAVRRFVNLY